MKVDVDRGKEKITASENTVFMNEIVNEECLNEMELVIIYAGDPK